jgi:hypothetical protein
MSFRWLTYDLLGNRIQFNLKFLI